MCGIVGYVGNKKATPILIEGLLCLEYRGYDSAGIALKNSSDFQIIKSTGKIKKLEEKIKKSKLICADMGIAHTRWATHGKPSKVNSHPHSDNSKKISVVHNGIIENYAELKKDK